MLRGLLLVLAGLAAGFAIAWWRAPARPPSASGPAAIAGGMLPSAGAPQARNDLDAIATALDAERAQRAALTARVDALATAVEGLLEADASRGAALPDAPTEPSPRPPLRQRAREPADLGGRLLAAGFAPDRAEWIAQRTAELRMTQLQAQYDSAREGKPFDPTAVLAGERTLRSDLGDADYERYLQALDRPTSVPVRDVLASSPGERAGLQPGDEVVAYDGKRVFDFRELNALTLEGNAGESVVIQVRRNDQVLDLVMPRGPIGIFGGGFRGR
jgi:hypothetical protein